MGLQEYLIWSHEHTAWWAPNAQGYVKEVKDAGRYPAETVARYTLTCLPPGIEVAVPVVVAECHGTDCIWGIHLVTPNG